jgi:hypothetical protein
MAMKFGVCPIRHLATPRSSDHGGQAEQLGYDSVWVNSYGPSPSGAAGA